MIKKIKPAILLLIFFLFLQGAYGQVQKNMTDYLTQRFLRYCNAVPREEIFIHSDREDYIAGEDLWFKAYLIDRQSSRPSLNSKIVYFELLNPENRPVIQKRIKIDKGFGPGQIVLPDTLSSGAYTIRAYTSWMKNFLPFNCYMKEIKIYNALSNKAFRGKIYSDTIFKKGKVAGIIPATPDAGMTLRVNNFNPDTLEILVSTDNTFRSYNKNILNLFIQTHGLINHVSTEKILTATTRISIPKKELIPGINHITIFDSNGQPLYERFIYTPEKNKQFLMVNSAESYKTRDMISLDLAFGNEVINPLNTTNLSVSVSPVTYQSENMELSDYMVFGTEFGLLSQNTVKGRKINEFPPGIIDSLLLNVKSNWINWRTILSDELPVFRYQVENEDHYLTGKLLTPDQKAPDAEEYLILSTPGKVAEFQYTRTDDQGNFSFRVHIDESVKDLIIQPDDVTKNNKIIIESSFSDQYLQSEISVDSTNKPVSPLISKWSVNYQVRKIYGASSLGDPLNPIFPPIKPKRFYGKPDIELIMADYINLPVMEEVFFELIPGVSLKKKKSIYEISIADPVDKRPYETAPGLLIDGVIINDPSIIANLDPEIVEKIDIVKEKYSIGDYLFFGIVNVITKSGDYSCVTLPDYAIRLPYRVIDSVWSFASPDYSSAEMKNNRLPDFRNTLYWNPTVKPDKDGKAGIEFWSSDITSDYVINIQGITSDGKIISLRKIIKIK
jgi:hypothetical protein